jgi:hypothetical protein
MFSPNAGRVRDGLINLVCGVLLFWPVQRIYVLAQRALEFGDVTEYLRIPQFYTIVFILIMTCVTAVTMIFVGGVLLLRPAPKPQNS